jgi:hypothetical protein
MLDGEGPMLTWLSLGLAWAADIRGVTLSTHTWGAEWGSDAVSPALGELSELGANWVAYHPYARIGADGTVSWRPIDPNHPPEWLVRPIREAHARGMKVMVTPHLAYWGGPFSWRGAITFTDEASWQRFFVSYRQWIATLAVATREADAWVVGSELDATLARERDWRDTIAALRSVYPGPITYAANWDRYREVPFWDAVDAVGIQAYFPLSSGEHPDSRELTAAWERWAAELRSFHESTGKIVVFTELGYDDSEQAAAEPWANGSGGAELQRECLRAALRAVDEMPFVVGAFLWKWFPGAPGYGDFDMARPDLRQVIAERWSAAR